MFYTFLVLTDYFQTSPLACSYSKFVTILFLRELSLSKHISKGNRIYGEERKEEAKLKNHDYLSAHYYVIVCFL